MGTAIPVLEKLGLPQLLDDLQKLLDDQDTGEKF